MLDHPFNAAALLDAAIERAQALPVVDGPDSAPEDDKSLSAMLATMPLISVLPALWQTTSQSKTPRHERMPLRPDLLVASRELAPKYTAPAEDPTTQPAKAKKSSVSLQIIIHLAAG